MTMPRSAVFHIMLFLLPLVAGAQSFSATAVDTSFSGSAHDNFFGARLDLINLSGQTLDLAWERIEESGPAGWQTGVCIGTACLPPSVSNGTFWLPPASPENYILLDFYPDSVAGVGVAKIRLFEIGGTDTLILRYEGTALSVGLELISETSSSFSLFPNPSNDRLYWELPTGEFAQEVHVIGVDGKMLHLERSPQTPFLSLGDVPPGTYLIRIVGSKQLFARTFFKR